MNSMHMQAQLACKQNKAEGESLNSSQACLDDESDKNSQHRVGNNDTDKVGKKPIVIWFTGLSGSGKTTLATEIKNRYSSECKVITLDGDEIRKLYPQIGFTIEDRVKHNQKVIELCLKEKEADMVIVSLITPFQIIRDQARHQIENYFEVHLSTSLATCESRDPKGLYKKARLGEIKNMTGIDQEFEYPINSNLRIDTAMMGVSESAQMILECVLKKFNFIDRDPAKLTDQSTLAVEV